MSNIITPGGGLPAARQQAPQQQLNIDPSQCPEVFCTYCDSPTFITITRLRAVPVLLMPPEGGHVTLTTIHCSNCRRELDLQLAKKWAPLTQAERQDARSKSQKALAEKEAKSAGKPVIAGRSETQGVIAKKGKPDEAK
jgi:hypothetical protein